MERLLVRFVIFSLIISMAGIALAGPKIKAETVIYSVQGQVMKGYLAFDENLKGPRPGVLVVHEWWGLNDYARKRARMLAELGYTALAVDMYGNDKVAAYPADAQRFSSELIQNFPMAKARFLAGMEFLKEKPFVDPTRIAAIGYCFGGGIVLNMARQGVDLKGVVSFHGSLSPVQPAQAGVVKARTSSPHPSRSPPSRRRWRQPRWITNLSPIPMPCTASPTPMRISWPKNSTCRSPTTPRQTGNRGRRCSGFLTRSSR
jgi:hypothetical protein